MSTPHFSSATLTFLRALKRNNDREWFKARKERYERDVKTPMLAVIEQLAIDCKSFAPEIVASPKVSMYRIYRDTRFSADKTPLKTNVAASFPWRGLHRHQGAGLYFEVAPGWVWIGGGMYMPQPQQLVAVREHIAGHHKQLRAIVESPGFRRLVGPLHGDRLKRVPRGFPHDHPAAEYLKFRHFVAGAELPASLATSPAFYKKVLTIFREVTPLARFLNAAVLK